MNINKDFQNKLIGILILLLISTVWMTRYTIVTTGAGIAAYKLDRWTGEVESLRGAESYKIRPAPNQ